MQYNANTQRVAFYVYMYVFAFYVHVYVFAFYVYVSIFAANHKQSDFSSSAYNPFSTNKVLLYSEFSVMKIQVIGQKPKNWNHFIENDERRVWHF